MQAGYELAGRYVLEELLGQGAVGEVWRARDRELDRIVAVKVIRDRIADPKLARGFLGEARIAGRLQHPGLTVVHDIGEDDGQPFIVMELLHGRDLDAVLRDWPAGMPVDQVVSLGIQFADALRAAHAGGVVHRDLKPANLFLQDSGQLKICDFGIAVATDAASSLAPMSYVVGTPEYMSPEQCDGEHTGESGDLYSLGCVLYALLTGRSPFIGGPPLAVMAKHRTAVPAAPRVLRPAIPAGLDRLVVDLLAKDPAARPEDAAQVAVALRALRGEPGAVVTRSAPDRPGSAPGDARQPSGAARRAAAVPPGQAPAGPSADPVAVRSRQLLAAAASDGTARLWNPLTMQQTTVLGGHTGGINGMCSVTVDGRQFLAAAGSDGTARLWDPVTGQQTAVLRGHNHAVNAVCSVTVDGRQLLAAAASDGTARLWDPVTGEETAVLRGHNHAINAVCSVTVDGRQLLAAASSDGTARLWDPVAGRQTAILVGHERKVNAVCSVTVGDRQFLATASSDRTARLWDPTTRRQTAVLLAHSGAINGMCSVTVDGRQFLATASSDHTVELWDPAPRRRPTVLLWHTRLLWYTSAINAVCSVTVDGRPLPATGTGDGTVRLRRERPAEE